MTITYELAKELKDAGFREDIYLYDETKEVGNAPDLSELIEACGIDFGSLYQGFEVWIADSNRDLIHSLENEGSSPEEAVARLWLALNKK